MHWVFEVPHDVVARLLVADGKLRLPEAQRDWPHPENLRWHRENVFGQNLPMEDVPWA